MKNSITNIIEMATKLDGRVLSDYLYEEQKKSDLSSKVFFGMLTAEINEIKKRDVKLINQLDDKGLIISYKYHLVDTLVESMYEQSLLEREITPKLARILGYNLPENLQKSDSIEPKKPPVLSGKSILIDTEIIEPLFDELKMYFEGKEEQLKTVLKGEDIFEKLAWPLNQNQFSNLFQRLHKTNGIKNNFSQITTWICKNFIQKNGKDFNEVSVYDTLREKSNPPKKNMRLFNDLF